jgi:hypothetical protein
MMDAVVAWKEELKRLKKNAEPQSIREGESSNSSLSV